MNKISKKALSSVLAALCMFEINGKRDTESISKEAVDLIKAILMLVTFPIAYGFPMIVKYLTQKNSDDEAYSHVKGSNFSFKSIESKQIREGFANLVEEYP